MSTLWKAAVGLLIAFPMVAYVAASLIGPPSDDPVRRDPVHLVDLTDDSSPGDPDPDGEARPTGSRGSDRPLPDPDGDTDGDTLDDRLDDNGAEVVVPTPTEVREDDDDDGSESDDDGNGAGDDDGGDSDDGASDG